MSISLGKLCFGQKILPIMLTLCLMLLPSYYAQNCAGIIGSSLILRHLFLNSTNIINSVYRGRVDGGCGWVGGWWGWVGGKPKAG